jgi:tetratricopeptide (TPR) repeat protein
MATQNIEKIIATAKSNFQFKNYKKALEGFNTAHLHYLDNGDDLNAAEMANNISVVLLQLGKKDQALSIVEGTDIVFEAHGENIKQAMALGNFGAALETMKRFDEAERAYQKSADLLKMEGDSELRSHVLKSLATLQIRQGKQIESIFSMQQSLTEKSNPSIKDRFMRFLLKIPSKLINK